VHAIVTDATGGLSWSTVPDAVALDTPLNQRQIDVLSWIRDGCPDGSRSNRPTWTAARHPFGGGPTVDLAIGDTIVYPAHQNGTIVDRLETITGFDESYPQMRGVYFGARSGGLLTRVGTTRRVASVS